MLFPRILSQNAQMTLEIKVNDPHFQWWLRESQVGYLVMDKLNFPEIRVKMVKITLKVKVNDLRFQYQLRVSQDGQIYDKVKFTDKQTGRQRDGRTDGVKIRKNIYRSDRQIYFVLIDPVRCLQVLHHKMDLLSTT